MGYGSGKTKCHKVSQKVSSIVDMCKKVTLLGVIIKKGLISRADNDIRGVKRV